MLNLKEIAKATGGVLVTAGKGDDTLEDIERNASALAFFELLDKNLLKATKTYKQITFKSFVTPIFLSFGALSFNLVIDLQPNMTFNGKKIKSLFVAGIDGCSVQSNDDSVLDYKKTVTRTPISSPAQFNKAISKVLATIMKDIKPAK